MIYRVAICIPAEAEAAAEPALAGSGLPITSWQDISSDQMQYNLYCTSRAEADSAALQLQRLLQTACKTADTATIEQLPDDWRESWKKFFHAQRVSPRIIVTPDWEDPADITQADDIVIRINPGQGFGTGQHPTTRACLQFIDKLSATLPQAALLDAGCGSGILAIASAQLGFQKVCAFDNDPAAVQDAQRQAELNHVRQIDFRLAEISTAPFAVKFDVVAANLLAEILLKHAADLQEWTAPGGHLLIAGILQRQYNDVLACFNGLGFSEINSTIEGEWQSGHLIRG